MLYAYVLVLTCYAVMLLNSVLVYWRLIDIMFFLFPVAAILMVMFRASLKKTYICSLFCAWFLFESYQAITYPLGGKLYSAIYIAVALLCCIFIPYFLLIRSHARS